MVSVPEQAPPRYRGLSLGKQLILLTLGVAAVTTVVIVSVLLSRNRSQSSTEATQSSSQQRVKNTPTLRPTHAPSPGPTTTVPVVATVFDTPGLSEPPIGTPTFVPTFDLEILTARSTSMPSHTPTRRPQSPPTLVPTTDQPASSAPSTLSPSTAAPRITWAPLTVAPMTTSPSTIMSSTSPPVTLAQATGVPASTAFPIEAGTSAPTTAEPAVITTLPPVTTAPVDSIAPTESLNGGDAAATDAEDGLHCGCPSCDDVAWRTLADNYSCAVRIEWLQRQMGLSEEDACSQVGDMEFPVTCGACNPNTCHLGSDVSLSIEPVPTVTPTTSLSPSVSMAPSYATVPEDLVFRLKMYWEDGYFWQENTKERFYCIECTDCSRTGLNFHDQGEEVCDETSQCAVGNQIWIRKCGEDYRHGTDFRAIAVPGGYTQIQINESNLCLERTRKRYVTVQTCVPDRVQQHWHKISDNNKFAITPRDGSRDDEPFCLTQQHEPKGFELLGSKPCTLAHLWNTGYWTLYQPTFT